VSRRRVVALDEGIDRGLPVGGQDGPLVPGEAHVLWLEGPKRSRQRIEPIEERLRVWIHVDEDPATPALTANVAQTLELIGPRVELVLTVDERALTIQGITPAVEGAPELSDAARPLDQLATAVDAGVVEGLDAVFLGAHDENRLVADRVLQKRAHCGDLFLSTGHLPDLREESLVLERQELGIDVAPLRHEVLSEPPPLRNAIRVSHTPPPPSRSLAPE